jgi:hypothetical protein
MDLNKTITLRQLLDYCKRYDNENGSYPESEFEGQEVFCEICDYVFGGYEYNSQAQELFND